MAGFDLGSKAVKNLHIYYSRYLTSVTNDDTVGRDLHKVEPTRFEGDVYRLGIVSGYPVGGNLGPTPGVTIPDATDVDVDMANVYLTYAYFPIEISWDFEAKSEGSHSFIRATALAIERVKRFAQKHFERMFFGDGTGHLAGHSSSTHPAYVTRTATTPLTITVGNSYAVRFEKNMQVHFVSALSESATVRTGGPYTVSNIQFNTGSDTATITFAENTSGGDPPATGDFVIVSSAWRQGFYSGSHATTEEFGLLAGISDGNWALRPAVSSQENTQPQANTFQDIPSTTYGWQSIVIDAGGQNLGPRLFELANEQLQTIGSRGMDDIDCVFAHPRAIQKLRRQMLPMERFPVSSNPPEKIPAGTESATRPKSRYQTYGHLELVPSRFMPVDEAILENKSSVKILQNTPMQFAASDGSIWHRRETQPTYRATLYCYESIGFTCRNNAARIKNLDPTLS